MLWFAILDQKGSSTQISLLWVRIKHLHSISAAIPSSQKPRPPLSCAVNRCGTETSSLQGISECVRKTGVERHLVCLLFLLLNTVFSCSSLFLRKNIISFFIVFGLKPSGVGWVSQSHRLCLLSLLQICRVLTPARGRNPGKVAG